MKSTTKIALALGIVVVLCITAWIPIRGILRFDAHYPGGFTFIGRADGALGTEYVRAHMWRSPDDTSPLPDVTVYLRETPYALSDLTSELMQSMGGAEGEGGIWDGSGVVLNYRFENDRLTYFGLSPTVGTRPAPAPARNTDRFRLQVGDGTPFVLPVTQSELTRHAGSALRVTRNIAN